MSDSTTQAGILTSARYGKDKIRVFRIVRNGPLHDVVEYIVQVLLEGDIDARCLRSFVISPKTSPHILTPEHFALHLGTHILATYAHIHKAHVFIEKLRWSRISVGIEGQETLHPHSLPGMDAYTTLTEVSDRILSTSVDLSYTYKHSISIAFPTDERRLTFDVPRESSRPLNPFLDNIYQQTVESVQATLFRMAQQVVAENDAVETVTYTLPNKHYIPVDMRYIGVDNLTPSKAEVFMPVSAPSGLISATISRK
ncbi:uricase [Pisolithus croceorrhizus]|nr:uricase [Pisolithus croceorrhizus]